MCTSHWGNLRPERKNKKRRFDLFRSFSGSPKDGLVAIPLGECFGLRVRWSLQYHWSRWWRSWRSPLSQIGLEWVGWRPTFKKIIKSKSSLGTSYHSLITLARAHTAVLHIFAFPPSSLRYVLPPELLNCWRTTPFVTINCLKCCCFRFLWKYDY